jgi:hypothetical protein
MATWRSQSGEQKPQRERDQEPAMIAPAHHVSELAFRESNGLAVSLVWHRTTDSVTVIVSDLSSGGTFEIAAPASKAMDVFEHPFAYVPDVLAA